MEQDKMPIQEQAIAMRLTCPSCSELHIDVGDFATKVHHTHACQRCGMVWRPAIVPTVGVQFLPGFKNGDRAEVVDRVSAPVRAVVGWFAEQMEQTLRANDDKGGWQDDSALDLLRRLREETKELADELTTKATGTDLGGKRRQDRIVKEAADVANFAMMIADNARRA